MNGFVVMVRKTERLVLCTQLCDMDWSSVLTGCGPESSCKELMPKLVSLEINLDGITMWNAKLKSMHSIGAAIILVGQARVKCCGDGILC